MRGQVKSLKSLNFDLNFLTSSLIFSAGFSRDFFLLAEKIITNPINHFPFLRPSMIILKMAEIRTLPELPKITTHTSVWSRPQLRLVEAAVQALEQLYSSL